MRYKHSAALKSKGIMPKLGHGSCGLAAFSRRHAKYPRIASSAWIASRCSMGGRRAATGSWNHATRSTSKSYALAIHVIEVALLVCAEGLS